MESSFQCRICLADGEIPIFGEDDESDISLDIATFGDIQILEDGGFPKYICDSCFQLLMGAIVFRNAAKHSNDFLNNRLNSDYNGSIDLASPSDVISEPISTQSDDVEEDYIDSFKSGTLDSNCFSVDESIQGDDVETLLIIDSQSDTEDINVSEEQIYHNCDLCIMQFDSIQDCLQHVNTENHIVLANNSNRTRCKVCNDLALEESYEKQVEADETNIIKMFECTPCELQFDDKKDFKEHCRSETHKKSLKKPSGNQSKVQCTVCEKFITKSYLKMHVKLHGSKEEKDKLLWQCPYCKKSFVFSYYKAHIQRVHKDLIAQEDSMPKEDKATKSESPKYVCDKCGKVFKKTCNLKLHLLTHGSDMKYKCMFCPYRGLHAGLLKIHIRTHTRDYNYKCSQCPAKFLTKSNLSKHILRHNGSGDFQCTLCERTFYSKPQLKQHHEAVHSAVKNHICNICGKAFTCRNYMMCHQVRVHKRKKLTDVGRCPNYLLNEINGVTHTSDLDMSNSGETSPIYTVIN